MNPKEEDEMLRKIIESTPGKFDLEGEMPLVFDKHLRLLTREEIINRLIEGEE